MKGTIADVRCPSCGAPARYNIIKQEYLCGYCGGTVGTKEALAQKKGFRRLQQQKIKESAGQYRLLQADCSGCGATLVFQEGEAMASCAFCGRALVRTQYLASADLPELILPFRITREEAAGCLEDWRRRNARKAEAKHLAPLADRLAGFYLPYELVRGPVHCAVSRMDGGRTFHCGGYVDNVFVNCSNQLDNLLLDGMEPFELDDLKEFDFSYAAGQRIKVGDVDAGELQRRVADEVSHDYAPVVQETLETKAVTAQADTAAMLRLPVLLPVYYIAEGETMAAVNGQTGKVSVRAEKASHYYFLPWWFKAILATLLVSAGAFGAFCLGGMEVTGALLIAGMLALVLFIVTLCLFSDTVHNKFRVESGRKVFTSSGGPLRRKNGTLVQDRREIEKPVTPPVFFETLEGERRPVALDFAVFRRRLRMAVLAVLVLFLPVIVALFLNGFDFARLELGGSAVWFCIAVPVVPVYLLKFGLVDLYENPRIYLITDKGRKKRYRKKKEKGQRGETLGMVLRALFVPPVSLAVWFGILSFCVMCYLTAFGFD